MTDLIVLENGIALLNAEVAEKIAYFEQKKKEIKEVEEVLRAGIMEEMEKKGIKKIETDAMTITYKAPYDKETFQAKEFRANNPEMYDSYVKMSPCKASVSIKLKEESEDE